MGCRTDRVTVQRSCRPKRLLRAPDDRAGRSSPPRTRRPAPRSRRPPRARLRSCRSRRAASRVRRARQRPSCSRPRAACSRARRLRQGRSVAATESVIASANSEPSDRLTTATQPHAVPSPTVDASPTVPSHEPRCGEREVHAHPDHASAEEGDEQHPRDCDHVEQREERAGAALGPAALDERVGEPRIEAEEAERLEAEHESRRPGEAAAPRQVVDGLDRKGMSE